MSAEGAQDLGEVVLRNAREAGQVPPGRRDAGRQGGQLGQGADGVLGRDGDHGTAGNRSAPPEPDGRIAEFSIHKALDR